MSASERECLSANVSESVRLCECEGDEVSASVSV